MQQYAKYNRARVNTQLLCDLLLPSNAAHRTWPRPVTPRSKLHFASIPGSFVTANQRAVADFPAAIATLLCVYVTVGSTHRESSTTPTTINSLARRLVRTLNTCRKNEKQHTEENHSMWLCVKLHLNGQTDRHQESNLVQFSLKIWHLAAIIFMIFLMINWSNFVYLLVEPGFLSTRIFIKHRTPFPTGWMLPTDTTDNRTNIQSGVFVCPFRWSLTGERATAQQTL